MNHVLLSPVYAFAGLYALWVFFLAVMSLKRAKDAGLLTTTAKVFGYPVLFAGLLLDFVANTFVLTVLLCELPREGTVTSRLKRHVHGLAQVGSGMGRAAA